MRLAGASPSRERIANQRPFAHHPRVPQTTVEYHLTPEDVLAFSEYNIRINPEARRRHLWARRGPPLLALGAFGAYFYFTKGGNQHSILLLVGLAIFIGFSTGILFPRAARARQLRHLYLARDHAKQSGQPDPLPPTTLTVDSAGYTVEFLDKKIQRRWEDVEHAGRFRERFFVLTRELTSAAEGGALIVPDRAFADEDAAVEFAGTALEFWRGKKV